MATDSQIRELCTLATRNDAGQHFTEWSYHWQELEQQELIRVLRPVHAATGISYSQEHWQLEVTAAGQELVDAKPELHPA